MKTSLYNRYYKLGLEHFINKNILHLHKPNISTNVFYLAVILTVIAFAQIF